MKSTILSNTLGLMLLSSVMLGVSTSPAEAANNCVFAMSTKTWLLQGPCSTDETLVLPAGVTLNGQGFKITAVDPAGGNFKGAVIRNGGKSANVINLFLRTNLADFCNDESDKVIGILLDKAAGTVTSVNITMNKGAGASLCAEGVAIQAQSVPFNPKSGFNKVVVKTSTLNYNQRAAVVMVGNVSGRVEANLIKNNSGFGSPTRGIEAADGAKLYALNNEILRHSHDPIGTEPSYGILLNGVGQTTLLTNTLNYNDIAIRILGSTKVTAKLNYVRSSTLDGILMDDANGLPCTKNQLFANDSGKNGTNGIHLQNVFGLATDNLIKGNLVERNIGNGILAEGAIVPDAKRNKVQTNIANLNDVLDIADAGTTTIYSKNVCGTSTGAPVDCPVAP